MKKEHQLTGYFQAISKQKWKVPLFYKFLQISPTYRMAHLYINGLGENPVQYDRDRLISTYKRFGDVWKLSLEEWWFKHGIHHLGTTTQPKSYIAAKITNLSLPSADEADLHHSRSISAVYDQLSNQFFYQHAMDGYPDIALIAVPLNGRQRDIQKDVQSLVGDTLRAVPQSVRRKKKVMFQVNKIRRASLEKYILAVHARAKYGYKLKMLGDFLAKHYPQLGISLEGQDQRNLESQTSELLKKALYAAEWAGVGEFPKNTKHDRLRVQSARWPEQGGKLEIDPPNYDLSFDWPFLKTAIANGLIVSEA